MHAQKGAGSASGKARSQKDCFRDARAGMYSLVLVDSEEGKACKICSKEIDGKRRVVTCKRCEEGICREGDRA